MLSIVIPVYNEADYIVKVLEQVWKQKVDSVLEKEIVVVDDGSTDGTKKALKKFVGYKNIKVILKKEEPGERSCFERWFFSNNR